MHWLKQAIRPGLRRLRASFRRRRLKLLIPGTRPLRVVVGAGGVCEPGWIPTDVDVLDLLKPDDWRELFALGSIDVILAEHVWEHLTPSDGALAAAHCYSYLKVGGYLRVAVPDGRHPDPGYIHWVKPGGMGAGAADHKVLYDVESFSRLFEAAGYRVIPLEYFDELGRFHDQEWDPVGGMIHRSKRFDERNQKGKLDYTSLILDAIKP
jgi:predicted SAM-dependent methyltransferase